MSIKSWCVLTPADNGDFEYVVTDCNVAPHVQLQAEVEGLHSEPSERGQHEVVHESRHDLTTHRALQVGHEVVDQEGEVEQEHGPHQVDENPCGFTGLCLPVRGDEQRTSWLLIG